MNPLPSMASTSASISASILPSLAFSWWMLGKSATRTACSGRTPPAMCSRRRGPGPQGDVRFQQDTHAQEPSNNSRIPLFEGEQFANAQETENFAEGEGAGWCVVFTEEGAALREIC
ncbi:MAG: hypothetical protein ABIR94_02990 [Rubrivivax sp.]